MEEILALEKKLLQPDVRCSKEKLGELLSEQFMEFCSSGKIFVYDTEKAIDEEEDEKSLNWQIVDFHTKALGEDHILATYQLIKIENESRQLSLRSSIWEKSEGKWKMIFHQGTIVK